MKEGLKKNMPFILLLIIFEIASIHIRLTQLTRKHTPHFCLRILTRLKVLLTQPFDMSNPFCKQSTGVLNAAQLVSKFSCSNHIRKGMVGWLPQTTFIQMQSRRIEVDRQSRITCIFSWPPENVNSSSQ